MRSAWLRVREFEKSLHRSGTSTTSSQARCRVDSIGKEVQEWREHQNIWLAAPMSCGEQPKAQMESHPLPPGAAGSPGSPARMRGIKTPRGCSNEVTTTMGTGDRNRPHGSTVGHSSEQLHVPRTPRSKERSREKRGGRSWLGFRWNLGIKVSGCCRRAAPAQLSAERGIRD